MPLFSLEKPFLEKDIERAIFSNRDKIHERGFPRLYKKAHRQFVLESGRVVDIFTHEMANSRFCAKIIELKRGVIDDAALVQAMGYLNEVVYLTAQCYDDFHLECILAGASISPRLENISFQDPEISLYRYSFEIDGLWFNKHEPLNTDLAIWKAEQNK